MLFRLILIAGLYAGITAFLPDLSINPVDLYKAHKLPDIQQWSLLISIIICVELFVSLTKTGWQLMKWFYIAMTFVRITILLVVFGGSAYAFSGDVGGVTERVATMCNASGFAEQCSTATNTIKSMMVHIPSLP